VIELRTQRRSVEEGPWVVEAMIILRRHLGLWGTHVAVMLICRMWQPVKGCSQGPRCRCSWYGATASVSPPLAPPLGSHRRHPQALVRISAGKVSPPPLTLGTPPNQRWQGLAVTAALAPRHFSGSVLGSWRFSSNGTGA